MQQFPHIFSFGSSLYFSRKVQYNSPRKTERTGVCRVQGAHTMKYAFYTLGCKVNQYETQAMEQWLTAAGHTVGSFEEPCDCYIVNTCTVTAVADKKNRNVIRRCRKLNPAAILGVCGCYAQLKPEEVAGLGVDVVAGSAGREDFLRMMDEAARTRQKQIRVDDALRRHSFELLPAGGLLGRTRAMLKVQDGCCNFCSYCIIPFARGPVRSLPLADAVAQAKALAQEGYREIVITGIEIASWGAEWHDGSTLGDLLQAILAAIPETRVRLGSLEPRIIDEALCRRLQGFSNLCPQFHLSLQSGCDTVLQRMNRRYDTARYLESVRLLRQYFPGCAITTDLIVAFPGETEEEFAKTLTFLQTCDFAAMHIFPYSRRPGTKADAMPGQHSNAVKQARAAQAGAVADAMTRRYLEGLIGSTQAVLFEEDQDGCATGHAPNAVRVYLPTGGLHNEIRPVRITALFRDGVLGELVAP